MSTEIQDDEDGATAFEAEGDEGEATSSEMPEGEAAEETHGYLKGLIEALLFVAEAPLPLKDLARAAKIDKKRTAELVEELRAEYQPRGIQVHEIAGGFCFRSNPEYGGYVRGHLSARPVRLSRAQLETLAIIAYRQPITRPEVDDIRGVDAGPVLKGLLERDLIKILGKKDEPGRPMLYGTTQAFLELFNMQSLQDLPTLKEFTELSEESRKRFEEQLGEDAPLGPIEELAEALPSEAPAGEGAADGDSGPESFIDVPAPESVIREGQEDEDGEGAAVNAGTDDDESDDDDDESDDDDDDEPDDDDESDDDDDDESDDDDDDDESDDDDDDDDESDDDESDNGESEPPPAPAKKGPAPRKAPPPKKAPPKKAPPKKAPPKKAPPKRKR